jgi:hypothetical protein
MLSAVMQSMPSTELFVAAKEASAEVENWKESARRRAKAEVGRRKAERRRGNRKEVINRG